MSDQQQFNPDAVIELIDITGEIDPNSTSNRVILTVAIAGDNAHINYKCNRCGYEKQAPINKFRSFNNFVIACPTCDQGSNLEDL